MAKLTRADIEKVYEILRGHEIPPLPTGKFMALFEDESAIPPEQMISGSYLPDQGDYRHIGDIPNYHVFVPRI